MQATIHQILLNTFHKCRKTARIYLDTSFEESFIEIFQTATQRKLVVDLFLSYQCIKEIDKNPFLINKLFSLQSNGVNIYQLEREDYFNGAICLCQIDFKYTSFFTKTASEVKEIAGIPFEKVFSELNRKENEYMKERSETSIFFKAENHVLFSGNTTIISWELEGVDRVEIDGIGEVDSVGSKSIQVLDDTILILRAANRKRIKSKALFLQTIENIHIKYDVLFLNPASKKYVSLNTEEENHGVFGVSQGQKIKLIWSVENADHVQITPFNLAQNAGERIFNVEGSIAISIQANLQDQQASERIIIHEYPMPIFTEKLVNIDSDFLSKMEFNMHHYSRKASQYLDESQLSNAEASEKEIYAKIKNQEKKLLALTNELSFSNFYREHSIEKMNKSVLSRLKAYFKDQPDVVKMINLLNKTNHE